MKFITENIFLIVTALVSGVMLLLPLINRQMAGASVGSLEATRLINSGAIVLDVRKPDEFARGHVVGSRNIPMVDIDKRAGELPAGKAVELQPGGYHVMLMDLKQPMKAGDIVPADCRILESNGFTVDNSVITGESEPYELVRVLRKCPCKS